MPGYVGSTYGVVVEIADRRGSKDVTSWQFEGEWYRKGEDAPALTLKNAAGIDILDGPGGKINIAMDSTQTTSLGYGTMKFILWQRIDANNRTLLGEGYEEFKGVGGK